MQRLKLIRPKPDWRRLLCCPDPWKVCDILGHFIFP